MNIFLRWKAQVSDMVIPKGEYTVSIQRDQSQITLHGSGSDFKLPAQKRPSRAKVKRVALQFQPSMGEAAWILSVATPPNSEYFTIVKMLRDEDKKAEEEDARRVGNIINNGGRSF